MLPRFGTAAIVAKRIIFRRGSIVDQFSLPRLESPWNLLVISQCKPFAPVARICSGSNRPSHGREEAATPEKASEQLKAEKNTEVELTSTVKGHKRKEKKRGKKASTKGRSEDGSAEDSHGDKPTEGNVSAKQHSSVGRNRRERSPMRRNNSNAESPKRRKRTMQTRWTGLRNEGRTFQTGNVKSLKEMQAISLGAMVDSVWMTHQSPMLFSIKLVEAVRKHMKLPTGLLDNVLISIINAVDKRASAAKLSANRADLAIETLFRCTDAFDVRPGTSVLQALVRTARKDPNVERRSERAFSVFRFLRSAQLQTTADFVYSCFETCVSGMDVASAGVVMEYALQNGMCKDLEGSSGALQIDYYNGIMYCSLLASDFNTTSIAYSELLERGIEPNLVTENISLALSIERDDDHTAKILLGAMKRKTKSLEPFVTCSMLRQAGRRKDAKEVLRLFRELELQGRSALGSFGPFQDEELTICCNVMNELSLKSAALARGDPIYSVFYALRACSAAEESIQLLEYLVKQYSYNPPKYIVAMIMETCWRGGRLDLARTLRVQAELRTPQALDT